MKIKALLTNAITWLKSDEANLEAQLFLQHALNVNRAWLIAHEHENITPSIHEAYMALASVGRISLRNPPNEILPKLRIRRITLRSSALQLNK